MVAEVEIQLKQVAQKETNLLGVDSGGLGHGRVGAGEPNGHGVPRDAVEGVERDAVALDDALVLVVTGSVRLDAAHQPAALVRRQRRERQQVFTVDRVQLRESVLGRSRDLSDRRIEISTELHSNCPSGRPCEIEFSLNYPLF